MAVNMSCWVTDERPSRMAIIPASTHLALSSAPEYPFVRSTTLAVLIFFVFILSDGPTKSPSRKHRQELEFQSPCQIAQDGQRIIQDVGAIGCGDNFHILKHQGHPIQQAIA